VGELPKKAVVDASVIIAALNPDEEHHTVCRELLEDAERGHIELWAPNVVLVEVGRWTRDADPADATSRAKLEAFLDSPWLHTIEVTRAMIDLARAVVAETTVRTGIDGLYVAAAVLLGHTTVFAVDDRIEAATFRDVEGRRPPGATAPTLPFGPAAGTEAAAGDGTAPPLDEAARDVQLNDDEGDGDA
jgi:predicted nucleic acid-binding protein